MLHIRPFGENSKGISLFQDESYVTDDPVPRSRFEDAPFGIHLCVAADFGDFVRPLADLQYGPHFDRFERRGVVERRVEWGQLVAECGPCRLERRRYEDSLSPPQPAHNQRKAGVSV